MILEEGNQPRSSLNTPGYDYSNPRHKDLLINMSRKTYPIGIRAKQTGVLWVVINDADIFRSDNVGIFFMKLTTK
jgi:hypothetical protein